MSGVPRPNQAPQGWSLWRTEDACGTSKTQSCLTSSLTNAAVWMGRMTFGSTMLIGILSSLVASVVYATLALFIAARARKARARPFVGKYRMLGPHTLKPTGGTVIIAYEDDLLKNLMGPTPMLGVFAEHGTGNAPGTEDWTATVEVLGLSEIASGFYRYPNRDGGALRFAIVANNPDQITEYATPFDPADVPFKLVLERCKRSKT